MLRHGSIIMFILVLLVVEWGQRNQEHGLFLQSKHKLIRWPIYLILIVAIIILGGTPQDFIYFQF